MRLNHTTYPAFMQLQENPSEIRFPRDFIEHFKIEKVRKIIENIKKVYANLKPSNIYYVTDTFMDVVDESIDKLLPALKEMQESGQSIENDAYDSALFITKNGFMMHGVGIEDGRMYTDLFIFSREALVGYIHNIHKYYENGEDLLKGYIPVKGGNDPQEVVNMYFVGYLSILAFTCNCEIETKVLSPKEKTKISGVRYYNENGKTPVTVLDCQWYTQLIRNIPFNVRGHLRLQPCGEGRKKRKLIWIESFEKSGYVRKAKKLEHH
jgi:hypothetical protein